jgi:hypothetical protein
MEAAPWFEGFRIRGPVAREFVTVCDMKAIDANFNTSRWSPEIEVGRGRRAAHGIGAQAGRGRCRKARHRGCGLLQHPPRKPVAFFELIGFRDAIEMRAILSPCVGFLIPYAPSSPLVRMHVMRKLPVVPICRTPLPLRCRANQNDHSPVPQPQEGRIAIVTDVGCGMRWTRDVTRRMT